MPAFASTMIKILDENNISYGSDIVKIITPLGYQGTAKYFKELGIKMPEDELVSLMNDYALYEYENTIPAKENVIDVLKKLKADGANLNVLTASPHTTLDVCLKRLGMYDLFNNVWSCEDFNTTKADPEIYKMAADKIGKPVNEILFLDEPTLGLDVIARSELWDTIRLLKGKITIILTTHYMEEAEALSDRIGIMKGGKLLVVGSADELKKQAGTDKFEEAFVKIVKEEIR